jgi:hypothetical protein
MLLRHTGLIALLTTSLSTAAPGNLGTAEDRVAVEDVMARYVWAVDSFDADGYVAVFTEDAVIDATATSARDMRPFGRSSRISSNAATRTRRKDYRPATCIT